MNIFRLLAFLLLMGVAAPSALAQGCSMCGAQTNSGEGTRLTKYRGQGLNTGILYLAAVPYLAASALGFVWYRNRRRARQAQRPTAARASSAS